MGNLGAPEILIIFLLILVFFGAKKIPEIAQGMGKGIREFRKAAREIQEEQPEESHPAEAKATKEESGKSLEPPQCPKCSTVNKIGSKFCSECGERL